MGNYILLKIRNKKSELKIMYRCLVGNMIIRKNITANAVHVRGTLTYVANFTEFSENGGNM